jgi:hypothetical protein
MRIDSSGNVGIGTSSPGGRLDVSFGGLSILVGADSDATTRTNNTTKVARIGGAHYTNAEEPAAGLLLISNDTSNDLYIGGGTGVFNASTSLLFYTAANNTTTTGTERARITSGGDVLIGQTSQSFSGNGRLSVLGSNTAYAASIGSPSNGGSYFYVDLRTSAGVQTGAILSGNGTNTSYNTSSDYRLKENIAPMTGALDTVAQLKPCTYTWKVNGSTGQGFIAHELQEVVPECVTGEKDAVETYIDEDGNEQTRIKPQGIDTSFLVATLTAAIQELSAKNDALEARIAALEAVPGNE